MVSDVTWGFIAHCPEELRKAAPGGSDPTHRPLSELQAAFFQTAVNALAPVGFAELLLTREIARAGARMLRDDAAADLTYQHAEQAIAEVISPGVPTSGIDSILARICPPGPLESLTKARSLNANVLFQRLRQLSTLQQERASWNLSSREPDHRYACEESCLAHLVRRFRLGYQKCSRCKQRGSGNWLPARRCWQCSCGAQTGIAHGTVMSHSHMPLVSWFHAVRVILFSPNIGTTALASTIGIGRLATARSMRNKIRRAIAKDDASALLAGLDQIYLAV